MKLFWMVDMVGLVYDESGCFDDVCVCELLLLVVMVGSRLVCVMCVCVCVCFRFDSVILSDWLCVSVCVISLLSCGLLKCCYYGFLGVVLVGCVVCYGVLVC